MRIAFIDIIVGYAADAPDGGRPLGGTNSAVCFMARELTKVGISCTLINPATQAAEAHGVPSLPLSALTEISADPSYDAFVFCGRWTAEMVTLLRERTKKPLIAWMHEAQFEPTYVPALPAFDGAVFVSDWQQRVNQQHTYSRWRQVVIRNAMNPVFVDLYAPDEPIMAAKQTPPVLLYAGDFQRGAFHMAPILAELRTHDANFTAEIYCNLDVSTDAEKSAEYVEWLRGRPNITHVGKVSQAELAQRMKRASFFIAPNPWPETSCINLIQAMAAGLSCIITDRAALPETAHDFARVLPIEDRDNPVSFTMGINQKLFGLATAISLAERRESMWAAEQRMKTQREFFLANYQWHQRVATWIEYLKSFV